MISIRAVSGCVRMSEEMDVSVLNRKCGLIWLASASILAARSSFSCSCRRCSMRALFQILIGVATARTVASSTTVSVQASRAASGRIEEPLCSPHRSAEPLPQQFERDRRQQQDHLPVDLEAAHHLPGAAVKTAEDERREAPDRLLRTQLAQAAAGEPASDRERQRDELAVDQRRQAHHRADDRAPAYGPAITPARNAPSRVRSAAL